MKPAHRLVDQGFTVIEVLVSVAIIAILSSIVLFSTTEARQQARDNKRLADLRQLQLAIEVYAQEHGRYPEKCPGQSVTQKYVGPGAQTTINAVDQCDTEWIGGLAPEYIERLPEDPMSEYEDSQGYLYTTNAEGTEYKVLVFNSVERLLITSADQEFARCASSCATSEPRCDYSVNSTQRTYAVYSSGYACE